MVGSRFMNYTQCIILSQNLSSMLGGFLIYIFREFLQHCGKIFLIYFDGLLQYDFLFDGGVVLVMQRVQATQSSYYVETLSN